LVSGDDSAKGARQAKAAGIGLGEVEGALVLEEFKVAEDVGFYPCGVGFGVEGLEFGDDLLDRVIAVTTLDDFEAGAVQAESAFGHQEDLLVVVLA
jgi:hypothetical protein